MTTMTQRVEGIREKSRKAEFIPTVQLWLTVIFFSIAWVIGKTLKGIWSLLAFIWYAIAAGFTDGLGKGG